MKRSCQSMPKNIFHDDDVIDDVTGPQNFLLYSRLGEEVGSESKLLSSRHIDLR